MTDPKHGDFRMGPHGVPAVSKCWTNDGKHGDCVMQFQPHVGAYDADGWVAVPVADVEAVLAAYASGNAPTSHAVVPPRAQIVGGLLAGEEATVVRSGPVAAPAPALAAPNAARAKDDPGMKALATVLAAKAKTAATKTSTTAPLSSQEIFERRRQSASSWDAVNANVRKKM